MKLRIVFMSVLAVFILAVLTPGVQAQTKYPRPETYIPTWDTFEKHKKSFDDPRPVLKEYGLKQIVPKELYDKITFDQGKMKALWAEIVGFKAPDVVGKIAPEIKPGKYTYKDVQNNPAFKELMIPNLYNRMGPPKQFVGSIQEFEIIPTRQYYWALPIAEMTKKNAGKMKLDGKGYYVEGTWDGGFPFPRPSGQFKAQQIMYNIDLGLTYINWNENAFNQSRLVGYNKNLKKDYDGRNYIKRVTLAGRALMEPFGFFDSRAKQVGELDQYILAFESPRDQAGQVLQLTRYLGVEKYAQNLVYIPAFRRIRKMSGTDTQDAIGGQDLIFDDSGLWSQKLSPNRYPYKYEVLEEREYLTIAHTVDGSETIDGKTGAFKNIRLERRPMYLVKLSQMDKNYVYSYRLLWIDKENLYFHDISNYDQKGRLYRTYSSPAGWFPEAGMIAWWGMPQLSVDHVDEHSTTMAMPFMLPAVYTRDDVRIAGTQGQK